MAKIVPATHNFSNSDLTGLKGAWEDWDLCNLAEISAICKKPASELVAKYIKYGSTTDGVNSLTLFCAWHVCQYVGDSAVKMLEYLEDRCPSWIDDIFVSANWGKYVIDEELKITRFHIEYVAQCIADTIVTEFSEKGYTTYTYADDEWDFTIRLAIDIANEILGNKAVTLFSAESIGEDRTEWTVYWYRNALPHTVYSSFGIHYN